MSNQLLLVTGAAVFGVLGLLHLAYTFFTTKFDPYDASVADAMRNTSPRISRQTTMWRAWIGFNASHSLGAIVFAAMVVVLAARRMDVIVDAPVFAWIAAGNGLAYLALAKRYWFRIPLIGIALATACFVIAAVRLSVAG